MAKASVEYELGEDKAMKQSLKALANYYNIDSGNFVINDQTVTSASISGADITFADGVANISIDSGNFTVNGAEVGAMSVSGAVSVSTANDVAKIDVLSQAVTLQGAEVNNVSITGGRVSVDDKTANITIPSAFTVQGSEVSAISVTGAEVSVKSGVAYIDIDGTVTRSNPELTISPTNVTVGGVYGRTTVDCTYLSTAGLSVQGAGCEVINPEQVLIYGTGSNSTGKAYIFAQEDADYYQQYRVVNVTERSKIIDLSFANNTLTDKCGNTWNFHNSPVIENDAIHIVGNQNIWTLLDSTKDFSADNFKIEGNIYFTDNTGNATGLISAFQNNSPEVATTPDRNGILLQFINNKMWVLSSTIQNVWSFVDETSVEIAPDGTEYNFEYRRENGIFILTWNNEEVWRNETFTVDPIAKISDYIILGENMAYPAGNIWIKNLSVSKW